MIRQKLAYRNEYKCDACGTISIWGDSWKKYGDIFIEESEPESLIHVCSPGCVEIATKKIKDKEWIMPHYRLIKGSGGEVKKTSEGMGYGRYVNTKENA